MNMTKQKLKEIIREELARLQEGKFYVKSFSNNYDEMYLGNGGEFTDFQNSKTFSKASDAQKVAKKHKSKGAIAVVDSSGKSVKFAENINEDQYGDVSFSRRKLKLASEDAECILHCLSNKAENDELPNWWIDKVSKAADYLNVCRDYIKTDDLNGIHEDTEKEFPIWGIPPGAKREELLYTKAKSHAEAKKIVKILTNKHGVTKARIQVLDLAQNPADLWNSEKLLNKK
jgi:hypothetical protein